MSWPQDLGIHGKWHQNTGNVWIKSTGKYRQFRKVLLFYTIFYRFDPSALSFPVVLPRPRLYSHRSVCRCSTWCNYTDNRKFCLLSLFGTFHGKSCRNAAGTYWRGSQAKWTRQLRTVLARSTQHALSLTMRDDSNDGTNSHLPAVLSFATTMLVWLSWLTCTTAPPQNAHSLPYIRKECLHAVSTSCRSLLEPSQA